MNQNLRFLSKIGRLWNSITPPLEYQKQLKTKPQTHEIKRSNEPLWKIEFGQKNCRPRTIDLQIVNFALGNVEQIPFHVQRTKQHNLPVYEMYKQQRLLKYTLIKRVTGDVDALMKELMKITSNSEVEAKVGYIKIHGLHKEVVTNYLMRLGF